MIKLNKGQQLASDTIDGGDNIFITASGGYGKTFVTKTKRTENSLVFAPTGAAALVAGGVTNHRGVGAKVGVIKPSDWTTKPKKEIASVLASADRVFFDEISMTRIDMFGKIDGAFRKATGVDKPFGGKQIVATGDFFQLGAFVGANERAAYKSFYGDKILPFEHDAWNFKTVELTEPMRNVNVEEDGWLQTIRRGEGDIRGALQNIVSKAIPVEENKDSTRMCAYNKDADLHNTKCYLALKEKERIYKAMFTGDKKLLKEFPVGLEFKGKLGMKVMIVANAPFPCDDYVNGDTGVIVQLESDCIFVELTRGGIVIVPKHEFESFQYHLGATGKVSKHITGKMTQFPLAIGYASSIHKAQGATLPAATIDLGSRTFAEHIFYVGITRVPSLDKLSFVRTPNISDVIVNKKVQAFYRSLKV